MAWARIALLLACLTGAGVTTWPTEARAQGAGPAWTVIPEGQIGYEVRKDGARVFGLRGEVKGPGSGTARMQGAAKVDDQGRRIFSQMIEFEVDFKKIEPKLDLSYQASASGDQAVAIRYEFAAATAFDLKGASVVLDQGGYFTSGTYTLSAKDGAGKALAMPPREDRLATATARLDLKSRTGELTSIAFDPPCEVQTGKGGELRMWLLSKHIGPEAKKTVTMTVTFPAPVLFSAANQFVDTKEWFAYEPHSPNSEQGVIGMSDWLDKPAGRHGWLQMKDGNLAFADGTPVKFWGINVCSDCPASPNDLADQWADRCAKYGTNLVRMHKFAGQIGNSMIADKDDSSRLQEEPARRWDYFCAALKKRGVYIGWSHIYGYRLSPADKDRVLAYDEIMNAKVSPPWLWGSTSGLVNIAPDLQDLSILLTVNMLNRVNTVTGLRYADDPSLAYIELQNEDDIFWGFNQGYLNQCPTYKARFNKQFSEWLAAKYGNEEKMKAAWGKDGLKPNESLAAGTVEAVIHPYGTGRRDLDNCLFLHELQNAFYGRFAKAIRDTGYQGCIVGSCWQAGGSAAPHYYNIQSDRLVGIVDRHNYYNQSQPMLSKPGSGLLSTGMQQVSDRPFALSEWAESGEFSLEGPAIIAAYGLGLQGWDLSMEFASDIPGVARAFGPKQTYGSVCDELGQIGQYPALARMVLRGDVREGDPVAVRKVSMGELANGKIGFEDKINQDYNFIDFSSSFSPLAMAVGRVLLQYTDQAEKPAYTPLEPFVDTKQRVVRSNTKQLTWDYSGRGFFTIDTPGTQAAIGFAAGRDLPLTDLSIRLETPFAALYVTSLDPKQPIAQAKSLLVTALARTGDTGMLMDETASATVVEQGKEPLLMEPVRATVTIPHHKVASVVILDHDGVRTDRTVPSDDGRIVLDGRQTKAFYYEIVLE